MGRQDDRGRGDEPLVDALGYSAGDAAGQGLRNMLAVLTLPWALAWMLQSELIAETMRAFGE